LDQLLAQVGVIGEQFSRIIEELLAGLGDHLGWRFISHGQPRRLGHLAC